MGYAAVLDRSPQSWTLGTFHLAGDETYMALILLDMARQVPDNPDDRLDIGGAAKGLMFSYDLETMELSGDVEGIYNNRDTLVGPGFPPIPDSIMFWIGHCAEGASFWSNGAEIGAEIWTFACRSACLPHPPSV